MKRLIFSTTLFVSFFFLGTAFAASPCATPRAAVDALIYWQQIDSYNLEKSAECIDQDMFSDKKERLVLARKLKGILDGRGLFVEVEDIPGQADYLNQEGKARFVLFRHEPDLYVEKLDSRWVWSEHTLKAAPELYSDTFLFDVHAFNDHLPVWAHSMLFGLTLWQYFGLFSFLLIAVFIRALTKIFLTHWARKALFKVAAKWGDNLLLKSAKPVGTMGAGFFLAIVFPLLDLPIRMTQIGTIALRLLIALSAVFTIYRLVDVLTHWLTVKADQTASKLDDQLVPLVRTALKIFVVAVGAVVVLQNLNIDVGGLIAGLGLGGLAFALAAKDTIANLFGSATIFTDRPFHVGDWINVDGMDGTVEEVGFRSTRMRTFYDSVVSIPNAKIADSVVDNYGQRTYRRIMTTVGLTYDTTPEQLQAFVEGVRAIIMANENTRKGNHQIHFKDFGPASLDIMVYFFVKVETWAEELQERHRVFSEIIRLAHELKVEFAFPTQTLHINTLSNSSDMAPFQTPPIEDLQKTVADFGPDGKLSEPKGPPISSGFNIS